MLEYCVMTPRDYRTFDGKFDDHIIGYEWTLLVGNKPSNAVFVKKETEFSMELKIFYNTDIIEINSKGLTLNGKHIEDSDLENIVHHSVDNQQIFRMWKAGNDRAVYFKPLKTLLRRASHAVTVESLIFNRANTFGMCGNMNDNSQDDDNTAYILL